MQRLLKTQREIFANLQKENAIGGAAATPAATTPPEHPLKRNTNRRR